MTTITLSQPFDLADADADLLPYGLVDQILAVSDQWDTVTVRSVSCGGAGLGFVACLHPKRSWFRRAKPSLIMPWSETGTALDFRPCGAEGLNAALAELARANTTRGGTQ